MRTWYNRIAGQDLQRLAALSDGIFAVAMTLLVLDLRPPALPAEARWTTPLLWTPEGVGKELALLEALTALLPHVLPYLLSFLTLGLFWVGQQTQLHQFTTSNRHLAWIHLAFLLAVSLLPFSTELLAAFITYRLALVVYWLNLLWLGGVLFAGSRYAQHAGLFKEEVTVEMRSAAERRIVFYEACYTFTLLLSVVNTYLSIGLMILVQLNAAIAPRVGKLDRF